MFASPSLLPAPALDPTHVPGGPALVRVARGSPAADSWLRLLSGKRAHARWHVSLLANCYCSNNIIVY